jgi:hypothetical protein
MNSDYIFFASYMQPPLAEGAGLWSNSDELETVNGTHPHFPNSALLLTSRN